MIWNCDETRRHLLNDNLSDTALEHLAYCSVCQEMVALMPAPERDQTRQTTTEPNGLLRLLKQTELQVSKERGVWAWLRSRSTRMRRVMGLCVALVPAATHLAFSPRVNLGVYPLPRLLSVSVTLTLVIAVATGTLLHPLYQPRSLQTNRWVTLVAFILPFALVALAPALLLEHPIWIESPLEALRQAGVCSGYGSLLALPVVALFIAMDRQLGNGRLFLSLLAGLGGLVGNFALLLHCPNEQLGHLLLGHATVGVLLYVIVRTAMRLARP